MFKVTGLNANGSMSTFHVAANVAEWVNPIRKSRQKILLSQKYCGEHGFAGTSAIYVFIFRIQFSLAIGRRLSGTSGTQPPRKCEFRGLDWFLELSEKR